MSSKSSSQAARRTKTANFAVQAEMSLQHAALRSAHEYNKYLIFTSNHIDCWAS